MATKPEAKICYLFIEKGERLKELMSPALLDVWSQNITRIYILRRYTKCGELYSFPDLSNNFRRMMENSPMLFGTPTTHLLNIELTHLKAFPDDHPINLGTLGERVMYLPFFTFLHKERKKNISQWWFVKKTGLCFYYETCRERINLWSFVSHSLYCRMHLW